MKLEGIHHITAITGDAPQNLDFYTRVLGLRLVKKTVNQDDPTVYHLFYADEQGSPGADLTFFEYPGAAPGRAGAGMVHRIGWRVGVGGGARLLGRRGWPPRAWRPSATETWLRFRDPEGLEHELGVSTRGDAPLIADHPEVPAEHALQGFDFVRAYSADPDASRQLIEDALGFEPREDGWEVRGEQPRRPLRLRPAAPPSPACPARAPCTTWRSPPRWTSTRRGASARRQGGARPTEVIDRFWFQLDLLPRAERRAVRDRHARARVRRRRGGRAPRREARTAAEVRADARPDRGDASRRSRTRARTQRVSVPHRLRPAAGEPEGALVLMHGRATDENDLFPLLDLLDPERRLLGRHAARAAEPAARRAPLVRGEAGRLPGPRDVPPHLRRSSPTGSTGCWPSTAIDHARAGARRLLPGHRDGVLGGPRGRAAAAGGHHRPQRVHPHRRGVRDRPGGPRRGCPWRSGTGLPIRSSAWSSRATRASGSRPRART